MAFIRGCKCGMEVARDEAVGVDNLAQRKPATHVWLGCKRRMRGLKGMS